MQISNYFHDNKINKFKQNFELTCKQPLLLYERLTSLSVLCFYNAFTFLGKRFFLSEI